MNYRDLRDLCRSVLAKGDDIRTETAREIAGYWHGGQDSAMYAFCSTGAYDRQALLAELSNCFDDAANINDPALITLGAYLCNRKE